MSMFGYVRLGPGRYRERFGLCFEDLRPGMVIHHRPGTDLPLEDWAHASDSNPCRNLCGM